MLASMSAYDNLTPRQRTFVEAYLVSGNATQAYQEAGYTSTGKAIGNNAARLIGSDRIKTALAERRAQLADANAVTPERVIEEWRRIAFFSLRHAATWTHAGLDLEDSATLSDEVAAAIAEVEVIPTEAGPRIKLRAHSKIAALRALSAHLDLFGNQAALEQLGQGLMGLLRTQARKEHTNGHTAPTS